MNRKPRSYSVSASARREAHRRCKYKCNSSSFVTALSETPQRSLPIHPTPRAMADAFQKKMQSEQRDRRGARRKQLARKQPERVVVVAPTLDSRAVGTMQ